jgi:diacylglycerol O-acyltransferase
MSSSESRSRPAAKPACGKLPEGARRDWIQKLYAETIAWPEVAPLFRRRAHRPGGALGAWSWQEDKEVDLEHYAALPAPGRVRELLALVSRLHGTLMERHRPLWEVHFIEGLEGKRVAVYAKVHHSLVDGVSAIRLLEHSLSPDPETQGMAPMFASLPRPSRPAPSAEGQSGLAAIPCAAMPTGAEVAGLAAVLLRAMAKAVRKQAASSAIRAPRTILNAPITGARRFAGQSWPIERIRSVSKATGTTLNDVVLAMWSGALRAYLESLGVLPGSPLVAMTPVSLRKAGEVGGNAVGTVLCNLATQLDDPMERLSGIHASMEEGKEYLRSLSPVQASLASVPALMTVVLAMVPGLRRVAPPGYNLVISNVPSPQHPLYYNGALMQGVYPLSIPTDGQAFNITVTSYNANLDFGLTGCRRNLPHLQRLLGLLEGGLRELEAAAGA